VSVNTALGTAITNRTLLGEAVRLQVRAELFNIWNHT
jgi:hypothetical protein